MFENWCSKLCRRVILFIIDYCCLKNESNDFSGYLVFEVVLVLYMCGSKLEEHQQILHLDNVQYCIYLFKTIYKCWRKFYYVKSLTYWHYMGDNCWYYAEKTCKINICQQMLLISLPWGPITSRIMFIIIIINYNYQAAYCNMSISIV